MLYWTVAGVNNSPLKEYGLRNKDICKAIAFKIAHQIS